MSAYAPSALELSVLVLVNFTNKPTRAKRYVIPVQSAERGAHTRRSIREEEPQPKAAFYCQSAASLLPKTGTADIFPGRHPMRHPEAATERTERKLHSGVLWL